MSQPSTNDVPTLNRPAKPPYGLILMVVIVIGIGIGLGVWQTGTPTIVQSSTTAVPDTGETWSLTPPSPPAAFKPAELTLIGIVDAGGTAMALINIHGRPQGPFTAGQEILPGIRVQSIQQDQVHILHAGTEYILKLKNKSQGTTVVALENPITEQSETKEPSPAVFSYGNNNFVLPRQAVAEHMKTSEDLLKGVRLVPNFGGGFIVREIQPNSLYENLGLQPGDIIRSINGYPVNSVEEALGLYRPFNDKEQQAVRMEIIRNGQPELLQYFLE